MFSKNYTNSGIRCQAANRPFLVFDFPNFGHAGKISVSRQSARKSRTKYGRLAIESLSWLRRFLEITDCLMLGLVSIYRAYAF